jgi:hypothetical protein
LVSVFPPSTTHTLSKGCFSVLYCCISSPSLHIYYPTNAKRPRHQYKMAAGLDLKAILAFAQQLALDVSGLLYIAS